MYFKKFILRLFVQKKEDFLPKVDIWHLLSTKNYDLCMLVEITTSSTSAAIWRTDSPAAEPDTIGQIGELVGQLLLFDDSALLCTHLAQWVVAETHTRGHWMHNSVTNMSLTTNISEVMITCKKMSLLKYLFQCRNQVNVHSSQSIQQRKIDTFDVRVFLNAA